MTSKNYILLHENEEVPEGVQRQTKNADEDIECFKVIEERLSPSGRIEYWSYPLYAELPEDVVSGKAMLHPKGNVALKRFENNKVELGKGFVHAYANKEDAIRYMEASCVGYPETRPAIYRCVIPKGCDCIETFKETDDGELAKCYATFNIRFCEPLLERVNGVTRDYRRLERQVVAKKKFGIIYDESQINGDVVNDDD